MKSYDRKQCTIVVYATQAKSYQAIVLLTSSAALPHNDLPDSFKNPNASRPRLGSNCQTAELVSSGELQWMTVYNNVVCFIIIRRVVAVCDSHPKHLLTLRFDKKRNPVRGDADTTPWVMVS